MAKRKAESASGAHTDFRRAMSYGDYLHLDALRRSSGFQSYQYRLIEFTIGNKNEEMLAPHRHVASRHAELDATLRAPSLYDTAIALLARRGFTIDAKMLKRDFAKPYAANA